MKSFAVLIIRRALCLSPAVRCGILVAVQGLLLRLVGKVWGRGCKPAAVDIVALYSPPLLLRIWALILLDKEIFILLVARVLSSSATALPLQFEDPATPALRWADPMKRLLDVLALLLAPLARCSVDI